MTTTEQTAPDGVAPEAYGAPPPPPPPAGQQHSTNCVLLYESIEDYIRDAAVKGAEGYAVVATLQTDERAGFWRGVLLLGFALIWRPRRRLLVSYTRTS